MKCLNIVVFAVVLLILAGRSTAEEQRLTPEEEGRIRANISAVIPDCQVYFFYEPVNSPTITTVIVEADVGGPNDEYEGVRTIENDVYASALEAANEIIEKYLNEMKGPA